MDEFHAYSLHSRYNPQGEAARYVDALNPESSIRFIILIEPGLCYLVPPLRKKCPSAKILALHVKLHEAAQRELPRENKPDASWSPGAALGLEDFLETEIGDIEAPQVKIVEWRPAFKLYPNLYLELLAEAAAFIKRSDANTRTVKAFGRRWFKNFFHNLGIIRELLLPLPSGIPLVVTGAGPSLEDAIPLILLEKKKTKLGILAVSSSVAALNAGGLQPDMVISSDGGFWALPHLYECFRSRASFEAAFAAPLSAALPSQAAERPVLVIGDGSLWQSLILRGLNIPFITLPQRGTVTAAALDLAFSLSAGDIFLAGIDLAVKGVKSHARPYAFDRLMSEHASRLKPLYSQAFNRALALKQGGSFGIYASWFKNQLASYPRPPSSIGNNNAVFGALASFTSPRENSAGSAACLKDFVKTVKMPSHFKGAAKGAALLENAFNNENTAPQIKDELGALLFPGQASVSTAEIRETAASLLKPYIERCHG
jgi:hypothetical protein